MNFSDDEFEERHEIVLEQRNRYKRLLQDIVQGVPEIYGMASPYRQLTREEIIDLAKKELSR